MSETPQTPTAAKPRSRWRSYGRTSAPWVLLVLATVVVVVSSLTVFVKRDALSTPHWTNASGKLLEDPAVQNALAVYLVNQLYSRVDVEAKLRNDLPERVKPLAAPLSAALREVSLRATQALLARPETIALWKTANRIAHTQLIAVLDGGGSRLSTTNGNVVLDLHPILERLGQTSLGKKLLPELPPTAGQIVILQSKQLKTAQTATKILRALSVLLTVVALALYAAAVWLAPTRRRMLFWVGVSGILSGLLVLVSRRFGGDYLVDSLTGTKPEVKPAAAAVWAIMTEVLRNIAFSLLIYGAAIALAALLAGPTRVATTIRRWLAPTLDARPIASFGAVVALFLLVLTVGPTDVQRLVPLAILFGFALIGVEVLRRQTRREFPAAEPVS
jgi:hypothetical protein